MKGQLITERGTFLSDGFHTVTNRQLNTFNYIAFVRWSDITETPGCKLLHMRDILVQSMGSVYFS
jgi:hypothetical protein